MFGDPWVVWGALEGQIEGNLHAEASCAIHEAVEVIEGTQIWVDGVVAAFG